MSKTCAVVPAAGQGVRMGQDRPKQFLELAGQPILLYTLSTLVRTRVISEILVVAPKDFLVETEALVKNHFSTDGHEELIHRPADPEPVASMISGPAIVEHGQAPTIKVIVGGAERQDSVFNALEHLSSECEWVVVHDGVRPFVSHQLLKDTWDAACKTGASIAALPATDTVKRVGSKLVLETLERNQIWLAQTPQVFRKDIILKAYREARLHGWQCTDDASLVERIGVPVTVVQGERTNIKVTTPEDLVWASWFLSNRAGVACLPKDEAADQNSKCSETAYVIA